MEFKHLKYQAAKKIIILVKLAFLHLLFQSLSQENSYSSENIPLY